MWWWLSTYFAVAALAPELASYCAWGAVLLAMIGFLLYGDKEELPAALLVLLPVVWLLAGVIWWVMRLLGMLELQ